MYWLMEFRKMTLHDSLELLFACRYTCLVPIYNTSMLQNIILNIFQMHYLLVFCKMTLPNSNELLFACRYTCSSPYLMKLLFMETSMLVYNYDSTHVLAHRVS